MSAITASKAIAPEVSTSEFEFAHGKKPRGQGCWAFRFGPKADPVFYPYDTYAQALKRAKAHAKEIGAFKIIVCS